MIQNKIVSEPEAAWPESKRIGWDQFLDVGLDAILCSKLIDLLADPDLAGVGNILLPAKATGCHGCCRRRNTNRE